MGEEKVFYYTVLVCFTDRSQARFTFPEEHGEAMIRFVKSLKDHSDVPVDDIIIHLSDEEEIPF